MGIVDRVLRRLNGEAPFKKLLQGHLKSDPTRLQVVGDDLPVRAQGDLQRSLDAWLRAPGRRGEVVGVTTDMHEVRLATLASPSVADQRYGWRASVGPVEQKLVPLADGSTLTCVERGLLLLSDGDRRAAMLISGPCGVSYLRSIRVEVAAAERSVAERVLQQVRDGMRRHSIHRGCSLAVDTDCNGNIDVRFVPLPKVPREAVILPEGVLERIERQTVRFSERAETLQRMGRHLKRGVLLYGPPGTGKTFSGMFLASQMPDRTVMVVTGRAMGAIEQVMDLARQLAPSTVMIEDVDLIAENRVTTRNRNALPVMFELLNAMDGLAEDADVLFVLTTNRAEALEPALADRPGRVDQAIEVPLPDAGCRARLIELYGKGMKLTLHDRDGIIARTEGVSAAFMKELLRRAAVIAADASSSGATPEVTDAHVRDAMREMVVDGGPLTRRVLGATARDVA